MIWLDAHLSPRLAEWIRESLGYDAVAIRDLGLRDAEDTQIFSRGREAQAIILTKDKDFADMVVRQGSPPDVIWLRCGNTSEVHLKGILSATYKPFSFSAGSLSVNRQGEAEFEFSSSDSAAFFRLGAN